MKPLLVLLIVFGLSLCINKMVSGSYALLFSGRIALSAMLLFTAVGHFVFTKGMTMMLPNVIAFKAEIIYLTGIFEILAALGLFFPISREFFGWALLLFFVLIIPANIHAAIHHVDYQKGTFNGYGLTYLWFRIPLQLFFMAWTYLFTTNPTLISQYSTP